MNYEAWIWTELLAFDNTEKDQGVSGYLKKTGFVPKGVCLLVSSPDFVLLHDGINEEKILPADICSRFGHERNKERGRQEWTNYQVRALVENLHKAGSEVYISTFTGCLADKFHHEWITEHPEAYTVMKNQGAVTDLNCLSRLKDGTYFEDYFILQVIRTALDYDFDGWHGADGNGPFVSSLPYTNCSDDMMGQFAEYLKKDLPEIITCQTNNTLQNKNVPPLQARMEWLWNNMRKEWINFTVSRWEIFWKKMVDSLHANGKKAIINSAWTKASFEAMYRFGIDYKRIAMTGVDYMLVETCATALSLVNDCKKRDFHYDFLAMLMEIKVFAPNMKLLFLHGVQDVVEEYDVLQHAPTCVERDIYSLSNIYYQNSKNELHRSADGFMVCLGDGIISEEWKWLKERWDLAFSAIPIRSGDITLLWSDKAFYSHLDDYLKKGTWSSHRSVFYLMERGMQILTASRIEDIAQLQSPLLVPYCHLLPEDEFNKVLNYRNGPVILLGDLQGKQLPENILSVKCDSITCSILNSSLKEQITNIPYVSEDFIAKTIPESFKEDICWREIPGIFWDKAASLIDKAVIAYNLQKNGITCYCHSDDNKTTLMSLVISDTVIHIAAQNRRLLYVKTEITVTRKIEKIKILGNYPSTEIIPDNNKFKVRIPPRGIVVVEVTVSSDEVARASCQ